MERKYSISGNEKAIDMLMIYLAMKRKLIEGYEGDSPDIMRTRLAGGAILLRNYKTPYVEVVNPDRGTVRTLARIIRRRN